MDKPQVIALFEKNLNYSFFDVKWIPCSAKFCTIGTKPKGTGVVGIYELNEESLDLVSEIEQKTPLRCATFGASTIRDGHLALGDFSGNLQVLDLDAPDTPVYVVEKAHAGIINAIDGVAGAALNCGAPEIATGGKDGAVKIWDVRQASVPVANISAEAGDKARDCWAVAFGDSFNSAERAIAAGYDNGDLKLFDLRAMQLRWETNLKNGICGLEFDRKDIRMNKLLATTLEGGLHVFDMRTQHPTKGFASVAERNAGRSLGSHGVIGGAKATVWAVKHLPQNRDVFVSCGGAGSVRLWRYEYPAKREKSGADEVAEGVAGTLDMLNATTLSTQPVSSFDWSPDRQGLAVCGALDQTVRVLIATKLNLYN